MPSGPAHDLSEMDNAKLFSLYWKIMFISGMGFFTDAYDLFIIGVVMSLVKPIWADRQGEGKSCRFHGAAGSGD
jgi:hypothetical protein